LILISLALQEIWIIIKTQFCLDDMINFALQVILIIFPKKKKFLENPKKLKHPKYTQHAQLKNTSFLLAK